MPADGDDGCDAAGMKVEFLPTREARLAKGDPRPSLEERYPTKAEYVAKVTAAAEALKRDRLMLDEDVAAYVRKANETNIGR